MSVSFRSLRWTWFGLLGFAASGAGAQTPELSLDEMVRTYQREAGIPSVQVAIRRHGRLVYSGAHGHSNLEVMSPARRDSVYEIGSVTKQFTAALLLMAETEGKLKLDDPIGQHLPDLPEPWRSITLRQCLNHTSGLRDYLAGLFNMRKDFRPQEVIDLVAKQPLDFPSGSAWSYSNTGYFLGGMILERIYRKPYREVLKERIFEPLGMTRTRTYSPSVVIPQRATGYAVGTSGPTIPELLRESAAYSAGNIISTAEDQTRWLEAVRTGKILTPDQRDAAWARSPIAEGRSYPYGLGWFVHDTFGQNWVEHGGNTFGQSAGNFIFPAQGLVISIHTNKAGINVTGLGLALAQRVDRSLRTVPVRPLPVDPHPGLSRRFRDALNALSLNQATEADFTSEILGLARTARGRMSNSMSRAATGQLLRLRPIASEPGLGVTRTFFEALYAKARVGLTISATPDGRITQIEGGSLELPEAYVLKHNVRTAR